MEFIPAKEKIISRKVLAKDYVNRIKLHEIFNTAYINICYILYFYIIKIPFYGHIFPFMGFFSLLWAYFPFCAYIFLLLAYLPFYTYIFFLWAPFPFYGLIFLFMGTVLLAFYFYVYSLINLNIY